jgi:hypothetical protein
LRLLIEEKHDSIGRGIEVEAHDVVNPLFCVRIGDEVEALETVRFEVVGFPDAVDRGVRDPRAASHFSGGPLAQATLGLAEGDRDDLGPLALGDDRRPTRPRALEDSRETLLGDPATDAAHLDRRVPAAARHLGSAYTLAHEQNGAGAAAQSRGGRGGPHKLLKVTPPLFGESEAAGLPGHGMGRCHG